MYSLRLTCNPEDVDLLSAELWEAGTAGIRELDGDSEITLIAGFETNQRRSELLERFAAYQPEWYAEDATDWARVSRDAWQPREVGQRIFLTPSWSEMATTPGRLRLIHNPGLACGTGEHPCTQLALQALENTVTPGCTVVDIGTGSGMLAIASLRLGAQNAIAIDLDYGALAAARENFELNGLCPDLVCGSADCIAPECSDVTVANISGAVLLAIWDDLLRITNRSGLVLLTGFPEVESRMFQAFLPGAQISAIGDWRCVVARRV